MNIKCSCCESVEELEERDLTAHWEKTYQKTEIEKLGWYEEIPEPSLRLIEKCKLDKNATQLHVGTGASNLLDQLISRGYNNIIANDISYVALDKLKERLGADRSKVLWVIDDLTHPKELIYMKKVDLWHDRAVVHFFSNKHEQDNYFNLLKKLVNKNGHVIIATFNLRGAEKCSGLPVYRFDQNMLQMKLGQDFELREAFDHTYTMPSGDSREYVYTLFQRIN